MKRRISVFLCICMILGLLSGCQFSFSKQGSNEVTVKNVDEFLSAIAPNTVIHLVDGTYNLSYAATYGKRSGSTYYKWADAYDGYELQIHDVENLAIVGTGQETTKIVVPSCNANVMTIDNSLNVSIENLTLGHTEALAPCSAGVIHTVMSENVTFLDLGIFGCGSIGVDADNTQGLTVSGCHIYSCSSTGIDLYHSADVTIADCELEKIGENVYGGYAAFGFSESSAIRVQNNQIHDNTLSYLLCGYGSSDTVLDGNAFRNNSVSSNMFDAYSSEFTITTGNTFEDNTFTHWYCFDSVHAVDENGAEFIPEDPAPMHSEVIPADSQPVVEGTQTEVRAATVDELLSALKPNTKIILTADEYNLCTASDYGIGDKQYYYWAEVYDGRELTIRNVQNLTITTEKEDSYGTTISAIPRYANVLCFENCANVELRGFTAGHSVEPGSCAGGVLQFVNCRNELVENCNLYGCGILGVQAFDTSALQIINSTIYECSYGGISLSNTRDVTIGGCDFRDLGGEIFQFYNCSDITIDGKEVGGNYYGS